MKEIIEKLNDDISVMTEEEMNKLQKFILEVYERFGIDTLKNVKELITYKTKTQYRLILQEIEELEEEF